MAVSLDLLGLGNLYSLAGIGAHNDRMVESARNAKSIVAIDGCEQACALKTIKQANLQATVWFCIAKEGVVKNNCLLMDQQQVEPVFEKIKEQLVKLK